MRQPGSACDPIMPQSPIFPEIGFSAMLRLCFCFLCFFSFLGFLPFSQPAVKLGCGHPPQESHSNSNNGQAVVITAKVIVRLNIAEYQLGCQQVPALNIRTTGIIFIFHSW